MRKNRIIIILGLLILFMPELGFTPSTKKFFIQLFAVLVVVLAFLIERKGVFSILWHKKSTTTPIANTYIEHNGAIPVSQSSANSTPTATASVEKI